MLNYLRSPFLILPITLVNATPLRRVDSVNITGGPPPGIYGTNYTKSGPVSQGNNTFPIQSNNTVNGSSEDVLFQNLLSAEWIVQDFYQQGVEFFNQTDFDAAGFPNDTLSRLAEILQNENGHLAIFEAAISEGVTKPGKCQYEYGFKSASTRTLAAQIYMVVLSQIELGSMAYLTGLAQAASTSIGLATVMGIVSVESRHLAWANYGPLGSDPFVGPSDTVYPWATQILSTTKQFIVEGSCPSSDPTYPVGDQFLPKFSLSNSSSITSGGHVDLAFRNATHGDQQPPSLTANETVYFNFFHSLWNYSVPVTIEDPLVLHAPLPNLTSYSGELIVALSKTSPLQNAEDVIAGPLLVEIDLSKYASY